MSIELSTGPFQLNSYHTLGLTLRKAKQQAYVNVVKTLAEDLHAAGFTISKDKFKSMTQDIDPDSYHCDDADHVYFTDLIAPIKGLGTNCIQSAHLTLPSTIPDLTERHEMVILEVTYKGTKPPKIEDAYRWIENPNGRSGYGNTPGLSVGGFAGDGFNLNYVSISEFAEDYMSRIPDWKAFGDKHKAKLVKLQAELKELQKPKAKKK
jgi:hypothetical protein